MNKLPKAKSQNILTQNLNNEILIYDLITNKAFCLNETSAVVFNACDGETTFDELKRKHQFTDDLIFLALDELKKESFLEDEIYQSPFAGMTRREAVKKVGLATMVALPVIYSVMAPSAAAAQSICIEVGQTCTGRSSIGDCCPGGWCGNVNICRACIPSGTRRCFTSPFDCQSLAYTCCSGGIVDSPFVISNCSDDAQFCTCI